MYVILIPLIIATICLIHFLNKLGETDQQKSGKQH